jgi:hypothetical protein
MVLVLGLTNQLVSRATDSGVGTDCEVADIEHSEDSKERAPEEEGVWTTGLGAWLLSNIWPLIILLIGSECGVSASRSSRLVLTAA